MSRNPRAAGRRFEQRIARDLRAWLGEDWTVMRNQTDRQAGQGGCAGEFTITGPHRFPFAIECKDGHGFDSRQLWRIPVPGPLVSTPSKRGFWAQAQDQADAVGLEPLLVFRRASTGTVLAAARRSAMIHIGAAGTRCDIEIERSWIRVVRWAAVLDTLPSMLFEMPGARRVA